MIILLSVDNSEVHTHSAHTCYFIKRARRRSCINYWRPWKGLGSRLSTGLWHLSRTRSSLCCHSSVLIHYLFLMHPTWLWSFPALCPLPSLPLQKTKENPHARLCLASAPLNPPLCLCPSLFCTPLQRPKGTHYPSPTHSHGHCCSICLCCFHWPVTSSLSLWLLLNNSCSKLTHCLIFFCTLHLISFWR